MNRSETNRDREIQVSDAPPKSASKRDWVDYALECGADSSEIEGLGRSQLIARYSEPDTEAEDGQVALMVERPPRPEGEANARVAGTKESAGFGEAVELDADQPRNAIEIAAALTGIAAAEAGTVAAEVSTVLLPGDAIAPPRPAAVPYEFAPGDGQSVEEST